MTPNTVPCPKCGESNPEKNMACARCGTLLHLMPCPQCGASNSVRRRECFQCGAALHTEKVLAEPVPDSPIEASHSAIQPTERSLLDESSLTGQLSNTSGHGPRFSAPTQARGWNWGAFWLTWVWGMTNNVWASLAVFLPGGILIVPFILGARGSEWAWQNRRFANGVPDFRVVQRRWAVWGWIFGVIEIAVIIWAMMVIPPKVTAVYNGYVKQYRDLQRQISKTTGQVNDSVNAYKKQLEDLLNEDILGQ